jgi:hypothetical protein
LQIRSIERAAMIHGPLASLIDAIAVEARPGLDALA